MSIRLCRNPYCKQSGHTIRNCNHESVQILKNKIKDISNFSIGFYYPSFLKLWLKSLPDTHIKILSYNYGISNFSRKDNEVNLFNIYYIYPIQNFIPLYRNVNNLSYFRESARRLISTQMYIQLTEELIVLGITVEPHIEKLQTYLKKGFNISTNIISETESATETECPICYDKLKQRFVRFNCNHTFCINCLTKYFENINNPSCALCRKKITNIGFTSIQDLHTINIKYLINDLNTLV